MKARTPENVTSSCTGAKISFNTFQLDPARSEGARYERAAVRAYLRRQISKWKTFGKSEDTTVATLGIVLEWVLSRQQRYDKAPGGLGKKIRRR